MRRSDDGLLGLALGGRGFADPHLAVVVGVFELGDLDVELGRLALEFRPLGRLLLLPLDRLGKPLLGFAFALAPFGLLARCGA